VQTQEDGALSITGADLHEIAGELGREEEIEEAEVDVEKPTPDR
jgi:hypothetical protein